MKRLAALIAVTQALACAPAWTQSAGYPNRAVTLVVPFPPGGGTDTGARIVAHKLSAKWGQQVVVDNRGGAAGQIGADQVAKARPDGYTILMGNIGTQAIDPSLYAKMPYDPDRAFAPISLVAELPLATMVNPGVAARTAPEFIALAKIGLVAPVGTPADIVDKIATDQRDVIAADDVKTRIVDLGGVPRTNTPAQFAQQIDNDRKRYAQVIRERKITLD